MKCKSEVFSHFCNFQSLVENLFKYKIKQFQCDEDQEFDNMPQKEHFLTIYLKESCPNTLQQNGVVESKHRHHLEMTRNFLIDAMMHVNFWLDVYSAFFTINCLPPPFCTVSFRMKFCFRECLIIPFLNPLCALKIFSKQTSTEIY